MSFAVRLSIALVTRNRPDCLRRCLSSVRAQQEAQPWEIVVSDDSDDPAIAREVAGEFGARHVPGPRRGLYANRNAAALACSGTHVRTMDDDHTFPAGHFACCLEAIRRDPRAVWVCDENGYLDGHLHREHQAAAQLHPSGVGGPVADPDDCWAIADGASIYPREVFARGLRMVEDFGYGSSYLEFGAFIYRHGFRSRLLRTTFVEHRAESATLASVEPRSQLFASLCYNLHFRPNWALAVRYIVSQAIVRRLSLSFSLPSLLRIARKRWNASLAEDNHVT